MSDNSLTAMVPNLLTDTAELNGAIGRVSKKFRGDVMHIYFEAGSDWMGVDSIFFKIVVSDQASRPARLRELSQRIVLALMNELRTEEKGVHTYFNFRSQTEFAEMNDPAWA